MGDLYDTAFTWKQKEDTINVRMKNFFIEENFLHPAVTNEDSAFFDDETNMYDIEELKSDPTAIGFVYWHGYEGTYYIAYSKKRKKIITYLSHD